MIRRLIILLLIVGCDNSTEPEDNIKEVDWIFTHEKYSQYPNDYPRIYMTDGVDFNQFYNDEGSAFLMDGVEYRCCDGDVQNYCVSIHHFVDLGYFHIQFGTYSKDISPDGYDVFLYEYK